MFKKSLKNIKLLIILEGLDTIPEINIIEKELIENNEKNIYENEEEYIDNMLDINEQDYKFKGALFLKNLKKSELGYELITKEQDIINYLKLFSTKDNKKILNNIIDSFNKAIIYSYQEERFLIPINKKNIVYKKNRYDNHLVMIDNAEEITQDINSFLDLEMGLS